MAPANIESKATHEDKESKEAPDMPLPEVHPPASRAPNTMRKPPMKELVLVMVMAVEMGIDIELTVRKLPNTEAITNGICHTLLRSKQFSL